MTVLVTTIKRFVGTSSDSKPDDAPVGSIFFESNSGDTYQYSTAGWVLQPDSGAAAAAATVDLLADVLSELRLLRYGQILKGLTEELTVDDLPLE